MWTCSRTRLALSPIQREISCRWGPRFRCAPLADAANTAKQVRLRQRWGAPSWPAESSFSSARCVHATRCCCQLTSGGFILLQGMCRSHSFHNDSFDLTQLTLTRAMCLLAVQGDVSILRSAVLPPGRAHQEVEAQAGGPGRGGGRQPAGLRPSPAGSTELPWPTMQCAGYRAAGPGVEAATFTDVHVYTARASRSLLPAEMAPMDAARVPPRPTSRHAALWETSCVITGLFIGCDAECFWGGGDPTFGARGRRADPHAVRPGLQGGAGPHHPVHPGADSEGPGQVPQGRGAGLLLQRAPRVPVLRQPDCLPAAALHAATPGQRAWVAAVQTQGQWAVAYCHADRPDARLGSLPATRTRSADCAGTAADLM